MSERENRIEVVCRWAFTAFVAIAVGIWLLWPWVT